MATREELQAKLDALMVTWQECQDEITIQQTLQHDVCVCLDEVRRQIEVIDNGEKRVEPLTKEAVVAAIAAAKPVIIKEEPIKEVIVTP